MVDVLRSFEPLTLPRLRGAHRHDVFSLKLGRRLTPYRRSAFEAWLMLEADPAAKTFCERPGFMTIDGRRCVVDFWVRSDDHECLVVLSETTPATNRPQSRLDFDPEAFAVRHIDAAERAAARVWTGNWQRMLPVLVAAQGLVKLSMFGAIERFLKSPCRARRAKPGVDDFTSFLVTALLRSTALASHNTMFLHLHLHTSVLGMLREHITINGTDLRLHDREASDQLLIQHRALCEAICNRRPEEARTAMQTNIDFVRNHVRAGHE